jgi:5-formyltetrahydrofolate cyclo-ligase
VNTVAAKRALRRRVGETRQALAAASDAEAQIVESIPYASHDRALGAIVTERAFRWARGES